ncbi:hypothetical protein AB4209_17640 [Vibrio sp. 10N.286.48.C11]|uniref:hypothetical protein n=1 Tax=Vibrio sp. 10N.286.48.C11 TaxID=3229698 RepID=UPI0035509FBA
MNYFFCTKPLQYFNCVNLVSNLHKGEENILFIIPNFYGAKELSEKIKIYDHNWDDVIIINNKRDRTLNKFNITQTDRVYIHSDLHFEMFFLGKFNHADFFVYEEGLGSYEKSITKITNRKWKNYIIYFLTKIGLVNSTPGKSKKNKKQYLYFPEKYEATHPDYAFKTFSFPFSFVENYLYNKDMFDNIFELNSIVLPEGNKICLYLSSNSRTINYMEYYELISYDYDFSIFKPHPNVADQYDNIDLEFRDKMAEILIMKLLDSDKFVDVYHHGTSAEQYIIDDRVQFKKV